MVVIDFAGAGAQALAWLHGVAGSSRTILEATDRYAAASLIDALGFEPKQFASPEVARAMATHTYFRACYLAPPHTPVAGVGCTATIATGRIKKGEHRCCLAVCDAQGVTTYTLTLSKGQRTRQQEEHLISQLIIKIVADVCDAGAGPAVDLLPTERLKTHFEPIDWLARLLTGEINWLAIAPDGRLTPGQVWPHVALVSGSFNPLHAGHRGMAQVAAEILQQAVFFELPIVNAGKGVIERAEVERRVAQFADFAPIILTQAPLFSQKARIFPYSVFVLGIDTVERILQLRFYHDSPAEMLAALELIRQAGCHFLVAGRRMPTNHFMTLQELQLPAGYQDLFEQIPEDHFRIDISSTEIRRGKS